MPLSTFEFRFPRWLVIAFASTFVFFQSATQTGFIPASVGVLQDRFNMTSSETGSLISAYDFAAAMAAAPVGYFCVAYAPRYLGLGMGVMGISIIAFTLANLLPPTPESSVGAYAILLVSQLLFGLGSSPLYVISPVYFAANMPKTLLSMALGVFYATSALGPAAGFVLGGLAVEYWEWWAAMLVLGILTILLSFFLFVSPIHFRGQGDIVLGHDDIDEAEKRDDNEEDGSRGIALDDAEEFSSQLVGDDEQLTPKPPSGKRKTRAPEGGRILFVRPKYALFVSAKVWNATMICLSEPTFMSNNIGIAMQTFFVSALTTFFTLFLSHAFGLQRGLAAIYLGLTVVPGAAGGIILGGFIVKRLDATIEQHIRMTYISTFLAGMFSFVFLLENYIVFLCLLAPMMTLVFIGTVSCNTIAMRAVPHRHRGMAVGIQNITFRLLGSVPGPLLMGALIDESCLEWDGSCKVYDVDFLRKTWLAFGLVASFITGVIFFLQQITWARRMSKERDLRLRLKQHSRRTGDEN